MVPQTSNLNSTLVTFDYHFICLNSRIANLDVGAKPESAEIILCEVATYMVLVVICY
jgi:hypothetical protein